MSKEKEAVVRITPYPTVMGDFAATTYTGSGLAGVRQDAVAEAFMPEGKIQLRRRHRGTYCRYSRVVMSICGKVKASRRT